MVHLVFADMVEGICGGKFLHPIAEEAQGVGRLHRIVIGLYQRQHVALGLEVADTEAREQVDHILREGNHRFHLVCEGQVFRCTDLVRETACNRGDGVDAATAHGGAQPIAQALQLQGLGEQVGIALRQGEDARLVDEVRRREHEQMRRMVLQVAAIHQKLAYHAGSLGDLDTEGLLDRFQVGDDMACRADAADTAGDIARLLVAAALHHALEHARRLDDFHLHVFDDAVFDDHMHVAVAFHACHVVYADGCPRHGIPPSRPRRALRWSG